MRPLDPLRVRKDVGRRIHELRRASGRTQEQLAELLELHEKYVSRVERGLENLGLDSLVKYANALDVPVQALFDEPSSRDVIAGRPPSAAQRSKPGRERPPR